VPPPQLSPRDAPTSLTANSSNPTSPSLHHRVIISSPGRRLALYLHVTFTDLPPQEPKQVVQVGKTHSLARVRTLEGRPPDQFTSAPYLPQTQQVRDVTSLFTAHVTTPSLNWHVHYTNLRNALANLRTAIGDRHATPPFLLITRETIQFNTASDYWLDVADFERQIADGQRQIANQKDLESAIRNLQSAIHLYRGSFLEGFFLKDSPAFEDWSLIVRERLPLSPAHPGRREREAAVNRSKR
jgi:hypothetical protein